MKDPKAIRRTLAAAGASVPAAGPDGLRALLPIQADGVSHEIFVIVASWAGGWDHVSVHVDRYPAGPARTPTWEEMERIKQLFWQPQEWATQFHPAEADKVNVHPHTLHIWKPQSKAFPRPPRDFV